MTVLCRTDRRRLHRALLLGLVASVLLTYASQQWPDRRLDRDNFFCKWAFTGFCINQAIGLSGDYDCVLPPVAEIDDPQKRAFFETIAERVRPYTSDPSRTYDVRVFLRGRPARGWPLQTVMHSAKIAIDSHSPGTAPTFDIIYADETGASPERPVRILCNWVFFFVCVTLVVWYTDGPVITPMCAFVGEAMRKAAAVYLRTRGHTRRRSALIAAGVLGLLAAWATHEGVSRIERVPFMGGWSHINLNSIMGLPNDYYPLDQDPLSGIYPVSDEMLAFCDRLATLAKPLVPVPHTPYVEVLVLVHDRHTRGWPFVTYESIAQVFVRDGPVNSRDRWQADFEVNSEAGPPYKWYGMAGNWLVFSVAALPVLWLVDVLLVWVLQRIKRKQRGFPVIAEEEA